jgi:hypothetical protein
MTNSAPFFPQTLSASEYVLALHSPEDRVAVLVRNRTRKQTLQRILAAEAIASPVFLYWLIEENDAGADIFLGMNPIKENSYNRTKDNTARFVMCISTWMKVPVRHYRPYERPGTYPPPISFWYLSGETPSRLASRRTRSRPSRVALTVSGNTVSGRHRRDGHIPGAPPARIRKPKVQRGVSGARNSGDGPYGKGKRTTFLLRSLTD